MSGPSANGQVLSSDIHQNTTLAIQQGKRRLL